MAAVKNWLSLRFWVGKTFHLGEVTFRRDSMALGVDWSRARENFTPANW